MQPRFKEFERNIRRRHRFGWSPKFSEKAFTKLTPKQGVALSGKVIESLGWVLVEQDESCVEAVKPQSHFQSGGDIKITFEPNGFTVVSETVSGGFWDYGRNSKRALLFIHAFKTIAQEYSPERLKTLVAQWDRKYNMDDYVIPASLPPYSGRGEPRSFILPVGSVLVALVLGVLLARFSVYDYRFFMLVETMAVILLHTSIRGLIKLGNYSDPQQLKYIHGVAISLQYVASALASILYLSWFQDHPEAITLMGLIEFIGLAIFRLLLAYYVSWIMLSLFFLRFVINRVPTEVSDFTIYHFVHDKSEEQVRKELSKKGWVDRQAQDEAIAAAGAMF